MHDFELCLSMQLNQEGSGLCFFIPGLCYYGFVESCHPVMRLQQCILKERIFFNGARYLKICIYSLLEFCFEHNHVWWSFERFDPIGVCALVAWCFKCFV